MNVDVNVIKKRQKELNNGKSPPPAKRRCKGRQGEGGQRHTGGARTEATASEIGSESTDDYVVEAIVARRGVGSSLCYLVRWRGYEN